jgi:tetratricopeptide (TPR) repeat protein
MTVGATGGAERGRLSSGPDRVVVILRWAIIFVVVCIGSLAVYAVMTGVLRPPVPRTQAELILVRSKAAVQANKADGQAWAQLARAQYLTGKKDEAYETIKLARASIDPAESPILWVNNQELDMVIRDGKNEQALTMAEGFIKTDAEIRLKKRAEQLSQGIDLPLEAQNADNETSIELFLLKATAETNLQKYEEAVKSYDNVLLMAPLASDVLTLRGWAKLDAGDEQGAKADFEAALKYMPDLESAKTGLNAIAAPSSDSQ